MMTTYILSILLITFLLWSLVCYNTSHRISDKIDKKVDEFSKKKTLKELQKINNKK